MRWLKDPLKCDHGKQRIIRKFLYLPKCIDGERRWLEACYIVQEVDTFDIGGSMEWGKYKNYWTDIMWADKRPDTN